MNVCIRAPVCAHDCSPLSPLLLFLFLPYDPSDIVTPSIFPFPSAFLPPWLPLIILFSLSLSSSSPTSSPILFSLSSRLPPHHLFPRFSSHQPFSVSSSLASRSLMDNRSIFFSLFPLCFSSVLPLLFVILLHRGATYTGVMYACTRGCVYIRENASALVSG